MVHEDVDARVDMHDQVNVYHTGDYRGIHPYYYHPYRPYYWGPHWHPLGFFLTSLAADAIWFNFNGQRYWYDDGCYYLPGNGGYSVVPPPVGAVVPSLPDGYETTMVGNDTYYYFGGAFYMQTDQGFEVVAVNVDSEVADARKFLKKQTVTFPVVGPAEDAVPNSYGVTGMPYGVVIDRQGHVRSMHAGLRASTLPALKRELQALLAEPAKEATKDAAKEVVAPPPAPGSNKPELFLFVDQF